MFVRRLVIGVRSSCEASATSWRWAATERSSVSSIALKCAASSPISSWVSTSIRRPRSSVAAMWRAASVTCAIGATTLRETSRPERDRERHAAEDDEQQDQPQPREHGVGGLQRAPELHREARPPTGHGQHAHVGPVDRRVGEEAPATTPAATSRARSSTGSWTCSVPITRDAAAGVDRPGCTGVGPPRRAGSGPKRGPATAGGRAAAPRRTSSWSSQRPVDLGAQRAAHGEVGDGGGERHRDRHRDRDRDRHPAAQRQRAHQSRRT